MHHRCAGYLCERLPPHSRRKGPCVPRLSQLFEPPFFLAKSVFQVHECTSANTSAPQTKLPKPNQDPKNHSKTYPDRINQLGHQDTEEDTYLPRESYGIHVLSEENSKRTFCDPFKGSKIRSLDKSFIIVSSQHTLLLCATDLGKLFFPSWWCTLSRFTMAESPWY